MLVQQHEERSIKAIRVTAGVAVLAIAAWFLAGAYASWLLGAVFEDTDKATLPFATLKVLVSIVALPFSCHYVAVVLYILALFCIALPVALARSSR